MNDVSCTSCLCGATGAMVFVLLLWFMKSFKCLSPFEVSFLLTSFEPPHMTTTSLVSVSFSSCAKAVTFVRPYPAITVPLTSHYFPRQFDISRAHPVAWLSLIMTIFYFLGLRVYLIFLLFSVTLLTCSCLWGDWNLFWRLSKTVYRLIIVGIGCDWYSGVSY
jgi:hypothetical protein